MLSIDVLLNEESIMQEARQVLKRLAIIGIVLLAPTGCVWADIPLNAGYTLEVVFSQPISSGSANVGDTIPIKTHTAIEYGGYTVVEVGSPGRAVVKSVTPAGKPGKPGRVEVSLVDLELYSPDGRYQTREGEKIMLRAADPITAEGMNRKTKSCILGFGLLIKGTEGVIPADMPYKAVIAKDIDILTD